MNRLLFLILLCVPGLAYADNDKDEHELLLQKLQDVKQVYQSEQARLRRITDNRWTQRQRQVEYKTQCQQKIDRVQNDIETIYNEIARLREENILRENSRTALETELNKQKERYEWIEKTIELIIEKEENALRNSFPINQQERALKLQKAALNSKSNSNQANQKFNMLHDYFLDRFAESRNVGLSKKSIVLPDNTLEEINLMRFGNVFAVGVDDSSWCYYLGSSGKNSQSSYEWIRLTDADAVSHLMKNMPLWMNSGTIKGDLYIDVIQNKFSGELLGAEKKSFMQKAVAMIKAGGIVMFPLGILLAWAIILIIERLIVFALAHSRGDRFIDEAVEYLNKNQIPEAKNLAGVSKGVLARILNTCLDHARWRRPVAEKAVKELLLAEVPELDKHLNTLAVIAAAAPLLGLLGTVTGMISMFESITSFGTGDPKLLAGGISEALVTTEIGLAIAIPVLLIHNFLRNRRNHIQADMEMYAMRILNRLWVKE